MKKPVTHLSKHSKVILLASLWLVIFLSGIGAYYCIFSAYPEVDPDYDKHTEVELITRACSSSFDLFFFTIDSNGVDGWLDSTESNAWVGVWLAISAVLAAGWTIAFVIFIVLAVFKHRLHTRHAGKQHFARLFIFRQLNPRALMMAKNILANSAGESIACLFVLTEGEIESDASIQDRLLHRLRAQHQAYKQVEELPNTFVVLSDDDADKSLWLNTRLVRRFIQHSQDIHIFLFDDDERVNLFGIAPLRSDAELQAKKTIIHCYARRNSINRVIEDIKTTLDSTKSDVEVRIVDTSYLAIEQLKSNVAHHPVQFVQLSPTKPLSVTSPFNAMIIGFSECGQDALKFLYEFSAFVDGKSTDDHVFRSPFHCHIIDSRLDESAARWIHHAQHLFSNTNHDASPMIELHNWDIHSKDFYDLLDQQLPELNYVVIALGNDETDITLAVDILRAARKTGKDLSRFRIYARSYKPDMTEYIRSIATHYNMDEQTGEPSERIVIFGDERELFTKEKLIDDIFMEKGKTYFARYNEEACKQGKDSPTTWQQRRDTAYSQPKPGKSYLGNLQDLRRQESQDRSNALHALTKLALYEKGGVKEVREQMAQLEHLRWVAAHELMGYQLADNKDHIAFTHPDMIPWEQLTENAKDYDRIVWDVTLLLQ